MNGREQPVAISADAVERQLRRLSEAWATACPEARERFLDAVEPARPHKARQRASKEARA